MKRYSIFLIILMLFISIAAWADQVTIGTGTNTQEGPLNRYWNYGAFEGIYLQSEIGPACTITSIGFNKASGTDVNPITSVSIYMKMTTDATLATGTYSTTGYTLVYNGSFPNTATSGWMEQTLTTPFNYDASSNLAILIVHGYQYWTSSRPYWYYTATGSYMTRATYQDDSAPTSLTESYNRPNIRITYTPSTPMVYASSTTTQNTSSLYAGDTYQQIIGMQVVMNGGLSPLSATQFTVNANGTTSASEISNARIYYTGTSSTFAATNQFGSTVASPTTTNFNITGSQVLFSGTNYFWLTFDISTSAVLGHVIDGECTSLIIGGVSHVPTITAPTGNRSVLIPLTGTKTIATTGGDYASFTEAINALNSTYVGTGGVTFLVTSGNTFTEDPPVITATGAADRPIIFQKSSTTAATLKPTGTSGTSDAGIAINGGDYITFDGINITIATGTAVEFGYYLYGTASNGAQHNTIKNCTISLGRANTLGKGIHTYSIATTPTGANSYNKFYSVNTINCYSGFNLTGSTTTGAEDTGNEIGTTSGVNSITSFGYSMGAAAAYGVYAYAQTNAKIFSTNAATSATSTGSIYGVYIGGSASTVDVYLNSVYTASSTSGSIYGIYIASGTTVNVYRNNIYGLTYSGSGAGSVHGIFAAGGTTNNIYNNMIRTLAAANSTGVPSQTGIYIYAGTTTNVYYNTVALSGTATGTSVSSAALYTTTNSTTIDLRNNIFVNNCASGSGGTGRAAAFWRGATGYTNISSLSNNNLYYAGTPGPKNFIFYNGTDSMQTLAEYKAAVAAREQLSVTENPPFISATNIHLSAAIATQAESGGTPITSPITVSVDFDNAARNASTPDIGADEGNFLILDGISPNISYTPLTNNANTTSVVLSNVIITDGSGVNVAAGTKPRVYFKKSTDANVFGANNSAANGWKWVETISGASPFSFTLTYSLLQSMPTGGETIQYFVVAQDLSTTPNVGAQPLVGFVGTSVATITSAPTTPNSYMVIASISGIKTIGTGGNYPTITNAVAVLNAGQVVGAVEYRLLDTSYSASETFPITINAVNGGSATNTVTFKPAPGISGITITSSNTTATIVLNGTSYVTFDGSNNGTASQDLTVTNNSTSAPVFSLTGASASNTIKNCVITGANTSSTSGLVFVGTTATGNGNVMDNCLFDVGASVPAIGVYFGGSFTGSQTISNSTFNGMSSYGSYSYNTSSNGVQYISNTFRNFGIYGIYLAYGNSPLVEKCSFTSSYPTSSTLGGVYIGNNPDAVVRKCMVHDLVGSTTATLVGIYVYGASSVVENFQVYNNEIYLENGAATTNGSVRGIDYYAWAANSCEIYYNSVYIGGTDVTGGSSYAMYKHDSATNFTVRNNVFVNARSNGTGTGKHYAVAFTNTTATTMVLNRNDYYATGTGGVLGIWSATDCSTISAWITASAQDPNSISANPSFTLGANYLRPYTSSPLMGAGTAVTGITDDILGGTRSSTTPSIGAYETGVAGGTLTVPANISVRLDGSTVEITWDVVPFATGYKVYWSTNPYGTTWTLLGSPTINDYIDTNSTPGLRFYKVTATQ